MDKQDGSISVYREDRSRRSELHLDVRFALKEVVITDGFLVDLEIQAHSKRAKERERARERRREKGEDALEVEYPDFYDHAVDYDFADAQIVRHLVSQYQNVTIHAPLASIQYPVLTRPLGYYEAVARPLGLLRYIKRDRRNNCEWVDWPKYLATEPYLSQFARAWWALPDMNLGALLSLDKLKPSRI